MGHSPPPSAVYVRSFLCPFFTLIKPPHKSPEWSSLVSGPKAKSSSEIMNLKSFTVMYQREILNLNACPKRLDRQCNPIWKDSPNEYEEAGGDSELLWEHSESTIEKTYLRSHTCLRFLSSISAHTVTLLKMSRYHRGLSFGGGAGLRLLPPSPSIWLHSTWGKVRSFSEAVSEVFSHTIPFLRNWTNV